jgi:hypothetical protein
MPRAVVDGAMPRNSLKAGILRKKVHERKELPVEHGL